MPINGPALGAIGAGGLFIYGAIKGVSVAQAIQAVITGKDPSKLPQVHAIGEPASLPPDSTSSGSSATPSSFVTGSTGSAIADAARKYDGKVPYVWGGGSPRGWDCSGFVNYVLGHDLGMVLPGGVRNFDGSSHGPIVPQYAIWSQAVTVPRAQAQAGDIVCYGAGLSHMGIAVSNSEVINAYDFGHVTEIDPLDKAGPPPVLVKRLKGTGPVNKAGTVPAIFA